jgi:UDP-N-acetylmuramoyl-tripeptide--D-alanyl-D-alanine ligase
VWLVGNEFTSIDCDYRKFRDVDEVRAAIRGQQPEGFYILIKGSNYNRLYQLPELL